MAQADGTIGVKAGSLAGTSMRYHELAVQRWLNRLFIVREGYPVPVVFATPMDAFSQFTKLWSAANNPFEYLLNAVSEDGTPLYQPHPAPVRYPLLSVYRKGFKYRSYQNFSIHRFRHINWPTVSADVTRCDLGNVTTSKMPLAWDYRFQLDFYCNRPDTQAFFVERLIRDFWKTGGTPQTWIEVNYPAWGKQLVRVYLDGDLENSTPEEPEPDKAVEFRTTATIVVEGFSVDLDFDILPAFWTLLIGTGSVDPTTLENSFSPIVTEDLRCHEENPTLDSRDNLPGPCPCETPSQLSTKYIYFGDPNLREQFPQGAPPYWPPQPGYPGGIPSSAAFGVPTLTKDANPVVSVSGADTVTQSGGFVFGSADSVVYTDIVTHAAGFKVGSAASAIVLSGTQADFASDLVGLFSGTLMNAVQFFNGTDYANGVTGFSNGTLFQVVVDGGVYVDAGTAFGGFQTGTLFTAIRVVGPLVDLGTITGGFSVGILA